MTFLDQLRTTDAVPKRDLSLAGRFRRRLVDALDQQAALAKAEAANETYVPTKQRWVRNKTSGDKELKVIPVRVRRWWWKDETGKVFLSLKPGGRLIEIAPGKRSIEIGGVEDLPARSKSCARPFVRASSMPARIPGRPVRSAPRSRMASPWASRPPGRRPSLLGPSLTFWAPSGLPRRARGSPFLFRAPLFAGPAPPYQPLRKALTFSAVAVEPKSPCDNADS